MADTRRRGLSDPWKATLRAVMPKGPFSLDDIAFAYPSATRHQIRSRVHQFCNSGHLQHVGEGRYDLTPRGIEAIMD
jgi:hypothetical protein